MSSIVRKLEVYDMLNHADWDVVKLAKWLNYVFSNLKVESLKSGENIYSLNGIKILIYADRFNVSYARYNNLWQICQTEHNLIYDQIQEIIVYMVYKHYKIKIPPPYCSDDLKYDDSFI